MTLVFLITTGVLALVAGTLFATNAVKQLGQTNLLVFWGMICVAASMATAGAALAASESSARIIGYLPLVSAGSVALFLVSVLIRTRRKDPSTRRRG